MYRLFTIYFLISIFIGHVQAEDSFLRPKSLKVIGNTTLSYAEVLNIADLETDEDITGYDIQRAIKNLWALDLFSDVDIYALIQRDNNIDLIIYLKELPRLNRLILNGNNDIDDDEIQNAIKNLHSTALSSYKLYSIQQKLKNLYVKQGYLQAQIKTYTIPVDSGQVNLIIDIKGGEEIEIDKISFHNNDTFSKSELLDVMQETKEDGWLRSAIFSEDGFQKDLLRLVNYYRSNGYRDAEIIKDTIYYNDDNSEMYIDIWLYEGNPNYFHKIDFEGNTVFSDARLYQSLGFKKNDLYSADKIRGAVEKKLIDLYYNIGYLYTTITTKETPISEDSTRISFLIEEGKEVKIRNIAISGNTTTEEKVIRRQLKVEPGQIFNKDLLIKSQTELWALNYFNNVSHSIKPVDDQNVDLEFEIAEKITTKTDFSAGWSEQAGLTGGIGLRMYNFIGNGQHAGINAYFGQRNKSISTEFIEPWFLNRPISIGLKLYYSDQDEAYTGYRQKSMGGALRIGHNLHGLTDGYHMDWIYQFDQTEFSNFSDRIIDLNPKGILNEDWPVSTSSLKNIISRNSLDRPDFPTSGSYIALTNEIAGGFLGGNADYHKHQINVDWYKALAENVVLKANIETGYMSGWKKNSRIPYSQKFFLGGNGTGSSTPLRGYIDPLSIESNDQNVGFSLFRAGLELRYRILSTPLIYVLTFAEAGETWNSFSNINLGNLRRSVGFGIRIDVPYLGIIGIDYAYGFDYFDPYSGSERGRWQFHIIIGELFK